MEVRRILDPGFMNASFKSKSFAEALSVSSSRESFPELRFGSFRGLPSLWISEEEINSLALPFQFALVGFFPTRRPSLDAIRKFFFGLKLNAEFSATVLDSNHVLVKLTNDLDYSRVFCHRSYLVNNCYMKLTKWSPSLDIGCESPVIPIWISFPNLRPHLYSPRILHALGSMFGKPLKVDSATSVGSRPSLARVLVELDITKTFPSLIWIGPETSGYTQKVLFEDFPDYCVSCKRLGHLRGKCESRELSVVNVVSTVTKPLSAHVSASPNLPLSVHNVAGSVEVIPNPLHSVCADGEETCSLAVLNEEPRVAVIPSPLAHVGLASGEPTVVDPGVNSEQGCGENVVLPVLSSPHVGIFAESPCELVQEDVGVGVANPIEVREIFGTGFCGLSEGDDPLSKTLDSSILNIPLAIVSKDAMQTHISKDCKVGQGDWLHVGNSSVDGDDYYDDFLDSRPEKKSGKRIARNSKKK